MTDPSMPGEPVGPETDDSQNPTEAAPGDGSRVQASLRDMLTQLQAMIDDMAVRSGPVLREVAAKAAELASVAGERAGPIAYKAAETTQKVGQRVAERGKVMAADLRRPPPAAESHDAGAADSGMPAGDEQPGQGSSDS
jgi:hypothetical protein